MTYSSDARLRCIALSLLLTACSADDPVAPVVQQATCGGASVSVRALEPLQHVVLSGADLRCFALAGDNREYLVVPQLTGALPYGGYGFRFSDPTAVTARVDAPASADPLWLRAAQGMQVNDDAPDAQARLDALLRRREAQWRPSGNARRGAPALNIRTVAADSLRSFSVLNTLDETPGYSRVGARLRFGGARVLLYVDTAAATAFTDAELLSMGTLYDQRLASIIYNAFGAGSDIDNNGRVIFLLTPVVNAIVSAASCNSGGFVRGFFYNHDLGSTESTSNRSEIFYGYVPDESARWSCRHPKADVLANLPPTFIHELQHMVSFGEHALERGGVAEEAWLNEGLSHLSEELGSLSYESRFPAPSGRTNPSSIFPDSASAFINPNLLYSYRYLFSSAIYSLTTCAPGTFCSLAERGGNWLFLRWMIDQYGSSVPRLLVETSLTGRANIEAATQRSTAALLGDFSLAVSADSVAGIARTAAPPALRFSSRNLRQLYNSLFNAFGLSGGVSRPFPIAPLTLTTGASVTGTMRPGTFVTYRLRLDAGVSVGILRFSALDGAAFPDASGAQVSVMRLP